MDDYMGFWSDEDFKEVGCLDTVVCRTHTLVLSGVRFYDVGYGYGRRNGDGTGGYSDVSHWNIDGGNSSNWIEEVRYK